MCLSNSLPSSRNSACLTRGEPPLTGAMLPASFSPWFLLICFSIDLSLVSLSIGPVVHPRNELRPAFEFAQYYVGCAAMLLRHDRNAQWNYDTCDTFWRLVKP